MKRSSHSTSSWSVTWCSRAAVRIVREQQPAPPSEEYDEQYGINEISHQFGVADDVIVSSDVAR